MCGAGTRGRPTTFTISTYSFYCAWCLMAMIYDPLLRMLSKLNVIDITVRIVHVF